MEKVFVVNENLKNGCRGSAVNVYETVEWNIVLPCFAVCQTLRSMLGIASPTAVEFLLCTNYTRSLHS